MDLLKQKRIRLKGVKLKELNNNIFERDNNTCVICHCNVEPDNKFHHQRLGVYKEDRIECGCVLCNGCHYELHYGKESKEYQIIVEDYLSVLYQKFWLNKFNKVSGDE